MNVGSVINVYVCALPTDGDDVWELLFILFLFFFSFFFSTIDKPLSRTPSLLLSLSRLFLFIIFFFFVFNRKQKPQNTHTHSYHMHTHSFCGNVCFISSTIARLTFCITHTHPCSPDRSLYFFAYPPLTHKVILHTYTVGELTRRNTHTHIYTHTRAWRPRTSSTFLFTKLLRGNNCTANFTRSPHHHPSHLYYDR